MDVSQSVQMREAGPEIVIPPTDEEKNRAAVERLNSEVEQLNREPDMPHIPDDDSTPTCAVCGEKWGSFKNDPFTGRTVHIQCAGGVVARKQYAQTTPVVSATRRTFDVPRSDETEHKPAPRFE